MIFRQNLQTTCYPKYLKLPASQRCCDVYESDSGVCSKSPRDVAAYFERRKITQPPLGTELACKRRSLDQYAGIEYRNPCTCTTFTVLYCFQSQISTVSAGRYQIIVTSWRHTCSNDTGKNSAPKLNDSHTIIDISTHEHGWQRSSGSRQECLPQSIMMDCSSLLSPLKQLTPSTLAKGRRRRCRRRLRKTDMVYAEAASPQSEGLPC